MAVDAVLQRVQNLLHFAIGVPKVSDEVGGQIAAESLCDGPWGAAGSTFQLIAQVRVTTQRSRANEFVHVQFQLSTELPDNEFFVRLRSRHVRGQCTSRTKAASEATPPQNPLNPLNIPVQTLNQTPAPAARSAPFEPAPICSIVTAQHAPRRVDSPSALLVEASDRFRDETTQ